MFRPRPHRLGVLSFFNQPSIRPTGTFTSAYSEKSASFSKPGDKPQDSDSIFSASESPWDHVFSDIDANAPPTNPPSRLPDAAKPGRKKAHGPNTTQRPILERASSVRQRRASMTAREMSVFDDMFDLIFNAVSTKEGKAASPSGPPSALGALPKHSASTSQTPSIGRAGAPLHDLFRTLRRHTSRVRWTSAIDEELDRKRETMELFNTDYELLQWVTMELFGEVGRWDEEAKKAIAASSSGTGKTKGESGCGDTVFAEGSSADPSTTSSDSASAPTRAPINPSIYPHLIAHAMRIFRATYFNPSLSLAIFNHTARVSIPSYVFGCTAPVYNELIEAKWDGWGDLEGVCQSLEEMKANGVKMDGRTRVVVETVRREVGAARPGELGEVNPLARRIWDELEEAEVMKLLHRMERVAFRDRSGKTRSSPHEETWKSAVLESGGDGWSFDEWDTKQKRKTSSALR